MAYARYTLAKKVIIWHQTRALKTNGSAIFHTGLENGHGIPEQIRGMNVSQHHVCLDTQTTDTKRTICQNNAANAATSSVFWAKLPQKAIPAVAKYRRAYTRAKNITWTTTNVFRFVQSRIPMKRVL